MSLVISAATLTNRAYAGNTGFKDENYRKNSINHDVVSADRKAMERALDRLGPVPARPPLVPGPQPLLGRARRSRR